MTLWWEISRNTEAGEFSLKSQRDRASREESWSWTSWIYLLYNLSRSLTRLWQENSLFSIRIIAISSGLFIDSVTQRYTFMQKEDWLQRNAKCVVSKTTTSGCTRDEKLLQREAAKLQRCTQEPQRDNYWQINDLKESDINYRHRMATNRCKATTKTHKTTTKSHTPQIRTTNCKKTTSELQTQKMSNKYKDTQNGPKERRHNCKET